MVPDEIGKAICEFVKNGDTDSFNMIYRWYRDRILCYIFRIVNFLNFKIIRDNANDIYQEVFVAILKKRHIFKSDCENKNPDYKRVENDFKNWVYLVATWKTLDFIKKHKRNVMLGLPEEIPENDKPQVNEIAIDQILIVLVTLAHLKTKEKTVFFLYHIIDLPYKKIANVLSTEGLNEEALKTNDDSLRKSCERARKKLQRYAASLRKKCQRAREKLRVLCPKELNLKQLKKEAMSLRGICLQSREKLESLLKQIPDDKKICESLKELELYIDALESFLEGFQS